MISQDRPPHKLLDGSCRDIGHDYEHGFQGMADVDLPIDALLDAHARLANELVANMPNIHREFLASFYRRKPDWTLLNVSGCENLPAIKWRELNLDKAGEGVGDAIIEQLDAVLNNRGRA